MRIFASVSAIPAGFWRWPHFSPQEWADKQDGTIGVDEAFMDKLEQLRVACGFPFVLNSAYRSVAHNIEVSATHSDSGPHTLGVACDVRVYGERAAALLASAIRFGFTGVGINQKLGSDPASRYIHIDMAPSRPEAPRPAVWSY